MDRNEIEELTYIILKDQNFDFKSCPDLKVNYHKGVLSIVLRDKPCIFYFHISFNTENLNLDYEIIQIFLNYSLKLFKIYNLRKGPEINLKNYNYKETINLQFQNLIDQYYLEIFGEKNEIIHTYILTNKLWLSNNNLTFITLPPLSEIQLEKYIKSLRSYEQWIKKKLKN